MKRFLLPTALTLYALAGMTFAQATPTPAPTIVPTTPGHLITLVLPESAEVIKTEPSRPLDWQISEKRSRTAHAMLLTVATPEGVRPGDMFCLSFRSESPNPERDPKPVTSSACIVYTGSAATL